MVNIIYEIHILYGEAYPKVCRDSMLIYNYIRFVFPMKIMDMLSYTIYKDQILELMREKQEYYRRREDGPELVLDNSNVTSSSEEQLLDRISHSWHNKKHPSGWLISG